LLRHFNTLTSLSDYQNLGICADTAAQGFLALESYLKVLGYEATLDQADIISSVGPVYIKFNTQKVALSRFPTQESIVSIGVLPILAGRINQRNLRSFTARLIWVS